MTRRTVRVAVLAAAGVGLALTQQACAGGDTGTGPTAAPSPATASAVAGSGTAPSRVAEAAPTTTGSHRGDGKAAICRSADIAAEATFQPPRAEGDTRLALLAVTNRSKRTCTVTGRAAISLANAAGEVVDVPTEEVNEPGPAVLITLRPGRTAFQGLKWTACDKADETCGVGNTLLVNLEASTDGPAARLVGFPAAQRSDLTMKSLSVGTLQPSAQGVVAW